MAEKRESGWSDFCERARARAPAATRLFLSSVCERAGSKDRPRAREHQVTWKSASITGPGHRSRSEPGPAVEHKETRS